MSFMPVDAAILFLWGICALILSSEDGALTPLARAPVVIIAGMSFWYALWLLSSWSPSPAGYPWQRVALDGAILFAATWRVYVVLAALRQNTGRLFALRPFGMNLGHGPPPSERA